MLKRKIEKYLGQWKEAADRKPLVIKGIRQCGKTYIVQKFATENYESVVYINFILEPDKKSAFHGNIDVDTIILNLSALIPGSRFINGKTCIILDEIQECKEARTSLKSFCIDGRFDIIATGSLLGVKGYGKTPYACRRYATTACGYRERPQASHAVPTCGRRYAPKNAIDTV